MLIPFHRLPRLGLILIALSCATIAHAFPKGIGSGAGEPASTTATPTLPPVLHYQDPEAAALRARLVEDGGSVVARLEVRTVSQGERAEVARAWSGPRAADAARKALCGLE